MASGVENATGVSFTSGQPFFDNIITNFFINTLADARNNSSVLWSILRKKAPTSVSGEFMTWPIRYGRNRGRNAIRPGGQQSDPGSQGAKTCIANVRIYQGRVKIDGDTLRRGRTDGGAYLEPVMFELEGQVDDIMIDHNRMAHNDGSGRLCEYVSGTTTVTARINQSIEGAATCPTSATIYLEVGDRIAFYASATDAYRAKATGSQVGLYVIAVSGNTFQVSLTPGGAAVDVTADTSGVTAGDWVVRYSTEAATKNVNAAGGARAEIMGIGGMGSDAGCLDGTGAANPALSAGGNSRQNGSYAYTATSVATANFQGNLADSTNPWNQAVVSDSPSAARPLTFRLLQQVISDYEERNNGNTEFMLFPYGTYNSLVALADPDKRYVNTTEIATGHKVITFNGIAGIKDRFMYGGRVVGVDTQQITYMENEPLRSDDYLDTPRWQKVPNYDEWFTGYVTSGNLVVEGPRQRAIWVLCDLSQ